MNKQIGITHRLRGLEKKFQEIEKRRKLNLLKNPLVLEIKGKKSVFNTVEGATMAWEGFMDEMLVDEKNEGFLERINKPT